MRIRKRVAQQQLHTTVAEKAESSNMTKSTTKAASAPPPPSVVRTAQPTLKKPVLENQIPVTRKRQATENDESRAIVISNQFSNVSYNRVSGRWQAWTNCMATKRVSRGPYVGEHATENLAARAQDRSLLKHRALATKLPIKLNFPEADYAPDEKFRNTLTNKEFLRLLSLESRACYRKVEATKCLQRFMAEEEALGNLPVKSEGKAKRAYKVKPLRDYLRIILMERPDEVDDPAAEEANAAEAANPPAEIANPLAAGELTWGAKRARYHRSLSFI